MKQQLKLSPETRRMKQLEEDDRAANAEFCAHCGERIIRDSGCEFWQRVFVVGDSLRASNNYCALCLLLDADREFVGQDPPHQECI